MAVRGQGTRCCLSEVSGFHDDIWGFLPGGWEEPFLSDHPLPVPSPRLQQHRVSGVLVADSPVLIFSHWVLSASAAWAGWWGRELFLVMPSVGLDVAVSGCCA